MIVPGRAPSVVDGPGSVHYGAMLGGPVDEAVLEVAAPPAGCRRVVLVASRIADRAAFEAVPRPGITDGAVYLVSCRRRRPVDRGHRIADQLHGTEVVEAAAPVRAGRRGAAGPASDLLLLRRARGRKLIQLEFCIHAEGCYPGMGGGQARQCGQGLGMAPSWTRMPSQSTPSQSLTMRPSRMPRCSTPQARTDRPVGGLPFRPPVSVPVTVHRAATRSSPMTRSSMLIRRSGKAAW